MGCTLACILYSSLHRLSLRLGLEGLVVICVKAECCLRLNPGLKAGVKGEGILALLHHSTYFRMQCGLEEHAHVVVNNVITLAGSDNVGTKQ